MQVHARGGHNREWRHLVAIFVSRAMASFHPHSLFQALLVLEPARTNRRTTSPACRRAQVGPLDSVQSGISKKYHAVHARGGSLLRFVRSAQHRVIDLGSTGHEQNRSRSPCSVFSSTRPPWPSDFLNCWPTLAGRESPKPCKDQGARADACECGSVYPILPLPGHLVYLCLLSSSPLLKSPQREREREREGGVYAQSIHTRVDEPRAGAQRDSSYTKGNPNTSAISMERQGERALAFIHRVWHP